jgi:transcriptional regulator with XRE-family HTH domain
MNGYATVLKARREQHKLTVRQLAERIERSTTFVTDFELKKKANPPEPEMMRRLAQALNWSVDEQLREWGYELSARKSPTGATRFRRAIPAGR